MSKKLGHWIIWMLFLGGIFLCVSIFSLCIGSVNIPLKKIFQLIVNPANTESITEYDILFDIRLPRIILGIAIGGALSISGVILQGMFRNPLVEPYTLGISGGAAIGVCLNIIFGLHHKTFYSFPLSGFIGAIGVISILYFLTARKGILKIQGLLLTGVMISFICSSLIMLIMAISRVEDLHGIVFWIMGSLQEPNWILIKISLIVAFAGLLVSYFFWSDLNAFVLGEEKAHHLGINVERTKRLLFIIASLLTGCCVSVGGIIGFVGLVVPHFVRMFLGHDHRILLISAFICGASFLVLCDTIARTIISPLELPVGVITGICGGSVFVYALYRKER